jgi:hypothetical protein
LGKLRRLIEKKSAFPAGEIWACRTDGPGKIHAEFVEPGKFLDGFHAFDDEVYPEINTYLRDRPDDRLPWTVGMNASVFTFRHAGMNDSCIPPGTPTYSVRTIKVRWKKCGSHPGPHLAGRRLAADSQERRNSWAESAQGF